MDGLMTSRVRQTVSLGELVVAAFDEARQMTVDPRAVAALVTQVVARVLGSASRRRRVSLRGG